MADQHHQNGQTTQSVNEVIFAVGTGVHMPRIKPVAGGGACNNVFQGVAGCVKWAAMTVPTVDNRRDLGVSRQRLIRLQVYCSRQGFRDSHSENRLAFASSRLPD
jgi:hypothetical protein